MFEKIMQMNPLRRWGKSAVEDIPQEVHADNLEVSPSENEDNPLLWRVVPLSEAALSDPVIMGLDPRFRMHRDNRDPESYTIFKTCIQKAGLEDVIPNSSSEAIKKMGLAYTNHLANNRVFVSQKNEFEGLRRLMVLGKDVMRTNGTLIITIDTAGILRSSVITQIDPDTKRSVESIAEVLELMRHGIDGWEIRPEEIHFDLNKRTKSARRNAHEATDWLPLFKWDMKLDPVPGGIADDKKISRSFRQNLNSTVHRTNGKIRGILRGHHQRNHSFIRWVITDALDADILRVMRGTTRTSIKDCIRLCATERDTVVTPDTEERAKLSMYRMQAVKAFPLMSGTFLRKSGYQREIDAGRPLIPILAEDFGVSEKVAKRLQGLTWQKASVSPNNMDYRLSQLFTLPEKHLPVTRQDYRDLSLISEFGSLIFRENLPEVMERLSAHQNPFLLTEKLRKNHPTDILDSVNFLARKLYLPALMHRAMQFAMERDLDLDTDPTGSRDLVQRIVSQFKVKELLELSERYHRNIQRYEDRINKLEDGNSWRAFMGKINLSEDLTAIEITSSERMSYQGRHENHCVGGYVSKVLNAHGRSATFIFSIEDRKGILSTVEMRVTAEEVKRKIQDSPTGEYEYLEKLQAEIRQHRGQGNSNPSGRAEAGAKTLATMIENTGAEDFKKYLRNLDRHNIIQREVDNMPRCVRDAGYSPFRKDHLEDAWEELSALLPRSVRKKGLDAFIAGSDLKDQKFSLSVGNRKTNPWDVDYLAGIAEKKKALAETLASPLAVADLASDASREKEHPIAMAAE